MTSVRIRGRLIPVTVVLLLGFLAARLLSTALLALAWTLFPDAPWSHQGFVSDPGFLGFLTSWDTQWYRLISQQGYPTVLPLAANGSVTFNTWAFFPVFPGITRVVMAATGLGFAVAGILVSLGTGAAATVMLHRLLMRQFEPTQALWGALFFAFGPMSFVLGLAYAESTFLLLIFVSLWFLQQKRYLAMIPFALVACFTHPGALALAAAIGIQGLHRLWRRQRIPHREWITGLTAIIVIVAATLVWPLLAYVSTGVAGAYFQTELAWWRPIFGAVIFVPFSPFFLLAGHFLGVLGVLLVVAVMAATTFAMTRRGARVYGPNIWTFAASYIAYLFAVFLPTGSLIRQLLPLSPLLGHPALSRTRRRRVITFCVCLACQPVTILLLWVMFPP